MKKQETILLFGDVHFPYHHKDFFKFMKAVKKKYKPTKVISTGDIIDNHAISFHDSDPDLDSPSGEFEKTKKNLAKLVEIFPKLDIVLGNHDVLMARRFKKHGLPKFWLRDFNDVFDLPSTWNWHPELIITLKNKERLCITHGRQKNTLRLAQEMGISCAQGHYHSQFGIQYSSNPANLIYGIDCGCLIDSKSLAMAYAKISPKRPILGCVVIVDGFPKAVPMIVKNGKWTGKL